MNILINRVMKLAGACAGIYAARFMIAPAVLEVYTVSGGSQIAFWTALTVPFFMLGYIGWLLGGWLSGYKECDTTTMTED